MRKIISILIGCVLLFIITACNTHNHKKSSPLHEEEFAELDLETSKKAIDNLKNMEQISEVHAVNNNNDLLVVITTDSIDRLQLEDIEKNAKEKLQEQIKDHKIHISTDEKLVIELEKLNKKIDDETISEKELNKKVTELIKLSKEQT